MVKECTVDNSTELGDVDKVGKETLSEYSGSKAEALNKIHDMETVRMFDEVYELAKTKGSSAADDFLPEAYFSSTGYSYSGTLMRSTNPFTRAISNRLLTDSVPTVKKGVKDIRLQSKHAQVDDLAQTFGETWYSQWEGGLVKDGKFQFTGNHPNYMTWMKDQKATGRKDWKPSVMGWRRGDGGWYGGQYNLMRYKEFNDLSARRVRGEVIPESTPGYNTAESRKAVDASAGLGSEMLKKILKKHKDEGVPGSENIDENFRYLTRNWSPSSLRIAEKNYGTQAVEELLVGAFKNMKVFATKKIKNPATGKMERPLIDANDADKLQLARHILHVIRKSQAGHDTSLHPLQIIKSFEKPEALREILERNTGLRKGDPSLEGIVDEVYGTTTNLRNAGIFKHRIELDELYIHPNRDLNLSISSLFNNNLDMIMRKYIRNSSGMVALTKHGLGTPQALKTMMDRKHTLDAQILNKIMNNAAREKQKWKFQRESDAIEVMIRDIKGQPLITNPDDGTNTIIRILGGLQHGRLMNQIYSANMSEFGVVQGQFSLGQFLVGFPALRQLLKRNKFHQASPLAQEFYNVFGVGDHYIKGLVMKGLDDADSRLAYEAPLGKHSTTNKGHGGILSMQGMQYNSALWKRMADIYGGQYMTTAPLQMFTLTQLLKRLAKLGDAYKNGMPLPSLVRKLHPHQKKAFGVVSTMSTKALENRLTAFNLNPAILEQVAKAISKSTTWKKGVLGGERIAWIDFQSVHFTPDILNATVRYLRRATRATIMESNKGERPFLGILQRLGLSPDSALGRLLWQFRHFQLASYEKHLGLNMRLNDYVSWSQYSHSYFMGVLMHIMKVHMMTAMLDKKQRNDILDHQLHPRVIALAGYQRAAYSTILPSVYNNFALFVTDDPTYMFGMQARSGLDQNFITGNPTVSWAYQVARRGIAGTVQGIFSKDERVDSGDIYKLYKMFPLYNNIILQGTAQKLTREFFPPPEGRK